MDGDHITTAMPPQQQSPEQLSDMKIPPPQTPEGIRAIAEHVSHIGHDREKMIAAQARGFHEIKVAVAAFEEGALSALGLLNKVKNIARLAGEAGA